MTKATNCDRVCCFYFLGEVSDCRALVTWQVTDGEKLRFEISAKTSGYVSLGFSEDKIMARTANWIYLCVSQEKNRNDTIKVLKL